MIRELDVLDMPVDLLIENWPSIQLEITPNAMVTAVIRIAEAGRIDEWYERFERWAHEPGMERQVLDIKGFKDQLEFEFTVARITDILEERKLM